MADQFLVQPPKGFEDIEGATEWVRAVTLTFNDLLRPDGVLDSVDATLLEQDADLVAVAAATDANTTNIAALLNSSPTYSISNAVTDRTFNANSASGAITDPPTKAEVEHIRDVLLETADVLSTIISDLANKDIVG